MNDSNRSSLLEHKTSDSAEVRALKELLANATSSCNTGYQFSESTTTYEPTKCSNEAKSLHIDLKHSEVQTGCHGVPRHIPINKNGCNKFDSQGQNQVCPLCFFTTHVLRAGFVKVVKDEICGTDVSKITLDKCIGDKVKYNEKWTSDTSLLPLLSFKRTEYTSSNESMSGSCRYPFKRNHSKSVLCDRPHFPLPEVSENVYGEEKKAISPYSVELEFFLNSIRPPLGSMQGFNN